jgi:hypothetical protein
MNWLYQRGVLFLAIIACFAPHQAKTAELVGVVDSANCEIIGGWVIDPDTYGSSMQVHIYKAEPDGSFSFVTNAGTTANRPDVGPGINSFTISTPASLKDGVAHKIYIYGIDTSGAGPNNPLINSGVYTVQCAKPKPPSVPSITNVSISSSSVRANGTTPYKISFTAYDSEGGANISHEYALINYQGSNSGQYRGYLTWYEASNYWGMNCAGGGSAVIQGGYGQSYLILDSCETTVSGNYRTTTFTVRFDRSFTAPVNYNDISAFTQNRNGNYQDWTNFDLNFQLIPPSTPVLSSVAINASPVKADSMTPYKITIKGTDSEGGANITHEYALINYQGANEGQYRGYLTWYEAPYYWGINCAGGGSAVVQSGYGQSYLILDSCETTVSGNERTTTFTVRFDRSYKTPVSGNNISGLIQNRNGNYQVWTNFATNFSIAQSCPLGMQAVGSAGICIFSSPTLAAQQAVASSPVPFTPEIWFAPVPSNIGGILTDANLVPLAGLSDYWRMFDQNAPWQLAKRRVNVFMLWGQSVSWLWANDPERLRKLLGDLKNNNIKLALSMASVSTTAACTPGGIAWNGAEIANLMSNIIKMAGGKLDYYEMDEPFSHHFHNPALRAGCALPLTGPTGMAANVKKVTDVFRLHFPGIKIGTIEPFEWLNYPTFKSEFETYLNEYKTLNGGKKLEFIHNENRPENADWIATDLIARQIAADQNVPYGVTRDGMHRGARNDAQWLEFARLRMRELKDLGRGEPAHSLIQSWDHLPTHIMPDTPTDTEYFASLINYYFSLFPANPPFGAFDSPTDGTTGVAGSIAVTGWALDDVEVKEVTICRSPVSGEPSGPDPRCGDEALVYIGKANFVAGARPDVAALYPANALKDRAGWGYMLLTNFLPNGGNGTYTLHAFATDTYAYVKKLGTKTISVNNRDSTTPFGTIDAPQPGEVVCGTLANFGWVLTQRATPSGTPKFLAADSSTIKLYIDGVERNIRASYGYFRTDLGALFQPTYDATYAGRYYSLNTTATGLNLSNGVHTIAWGVTDSAGNQAGIGSRYFTVQNPCAQ